VQLRTFAAADDLVSINPLSHTERAEFKVVFKTHRKTKQRTVSYSRRAK